MGDSGSEFLQKFGRNHELGREGREIRTCAPTRFVPSKGYSCPVPACEKFVDSVNKLCRNCTTAAKEAAAAIVAEVAKFFDVPLHCVRGRYRAARYTIPRQMAVYWIRRRTEFSWVGIGEYFGRSHSWAVYAFRRAEEIISGQTLRKQNAPMAKKIRLLTDQFTLRGDDKLSGGG